VLVKGLETRGALDNRLILFLSDNGANAESGPDGRFNGSPPSLRRTQPLFWEHQGNRAVRSGNWKLVSTYPDDWELYDLAADRVERNNLAARHRDIVKSLAKEWNAWAERAHVDPWPGPRRMPWGDDAPADGRERK
jgi:arylsulfatase